MSTAAAPATPSRDATPVLEMVGMTRRFGAVTAVDDVSLTCRRGEVLALVGENGAGKSTLMKLMTGVHRPDAGEMRLDGEPVRFRHPVDARDRGIVIIHQELTLLPYRTVAQNVFLGREPRRAGRVDVARMRAETDALLRRLGVRDVVAPDTPVHTLSVARQQMVEIAKALSAEARVLVMDEPTAALSQSETETLTGLVRQLRGDGVGVVYISHRLHEVMALADRVVVLRDGSVVGERLVDDELRETDLVRLMVGRDLDDYYPEPGSPDDLGDVLLRLEGAANAHVGPLDLQVRAGEVVGIGGLEGAGQQEVAEAVFGVEPFTEGRVVVAGTDGAPGSPRQAISAGLGYATADRKGDGLVLGQPILVNAELSQRAVGADAETRSRAERYLGDLDVRCASYRQAVGDLSGGNQQKVVLAKWLTAQAKVLLLHEPTRGVDVGSKAAIHDVLRDLARRGLGVVMISSDLPELIGASDRLVVMRDGRFVGELGHGAEEDDVMRLATGVAPAGAGVGSAGGSVRVAS